MSAVRPSGIIVPLSTPLDADEGLDRDVLGRLIEWLLPDVDAFFALGSSGELALLRPTVADEVVVAVTEIVAGRRPVYVGIGESGTKRAIDGLRRASAAGVDAVVACGPYYYPVTDQSALLGHFTTIAEASPVPLVLYNIPQNTVSALDSHTVARLARHPNIIGVKDSSGDMFAFQGFLASRSDAFAVLQGREQLALASLQLGADGIISSLANFAPGRLQALRGAAVRRDAGDARHLQTEISRLAEVFDQGHWLACMKAVHAELGFGSGRPAAPLPPVGTEGRAAIRDLLARARVHSLEVDHG